MYLTLFYRCISEQSEWSKLLSLYYTILVEQLFSTCAVLWKIRHEVAAIHPKSDEQPIESHQFPNPNPSKQLKKRDP